MIVKYCALVGLLVTGYSNTVYAAGQGNGGNPNRGGDSDTDTDTGDEGATDEPGSLNSCTRQAACIDIDVDPVNTDYCTGSACEYKVCLTLSVAKQGCGKDDDEKISHTCLPAGGDDPQVCNPNHWDQNIGSGSSYDYLLDEGTQCKTVPAGATATFILKDGRACSDDYTSPGGDITCTARNDAAGDLSCAGGGNDGKECFWRVTAPTTCGSTPDAPEPTPGPTPATPDTPDAPEPTPAPTPGPTPATPPGSPQCSETCTTGNGNSGNGVTKYKICRTSEGTSQSLCLPDAGIDLGNMDTCGYCDETPQCTETCTTGNGNSGNGVTKYKICRTSEGTSQNLCLPDAGINLGNMDTCGYCEPTPSPTPGPTTNGGANGDPHFKTWTGEHYDYHGLCDLVLLENRGFQDDLGMDIHIRTKKISQWSYISNAVIRIGEDTLEVTGSPDGSSHYWINGREGEQTKARMVLLESGLSGYPISFERKSEKQTEFNIDLGDDEMVVMKTWNDLVRVDVLGAKLHNFGSSRGLMGKFNTGEHMSRDGVTELKDLNAFGQEWQVQVWEPKLFHVLEGAQAPQLCEAPSAVEMRRRLRESVITQDEAEVACSHVDPADRDLCIFDVLATNDVDLAGAY